MSTTIDRLLETTQLTADELAENSKLSLERITAIAAGRWLASPSERTRLAEALGVSPEDVEWGHTMSPRNVRYHRFGVSEEF